MTPSFSETELEALLERPVCRLLTPPIARRSPAVACSITGAGGSIGSELARQIARCQPARLTLVDHSELNLFQIERELRRVGAGRAARCRPRRCHAARMRRRVPVDRPHVVYHAAAYKHVTMVERAVCAGVEANVLGTIAAVDAAREVGARFVLISSDKAAAPHSVMGATKRLAELVVMARAQRGVPADRRPLRQRARQQRQRADDHARAHSAAGSRCR